MNNTLLDIKTLSNEYFLIYLKNILKNDIIFINECNSVFDLFNEPEKYIITKQAIIINYIKNNIDILEDIFKNTPGEWF